MRLSRTFRIGEADWAQWIENPPASDDIDIDNDGVMTPAPAFLIDLSYATGYMTGYQASMMAGYRIHSITIGIRPVDDIDDNDESAFFAGQLRWYPPTQHAIKALQLMRKVERATEATEIDQDSLFLSVETDYLGMRFGWNSDNQVRYQTAESITGYGGTEWDITNVFSAYNAMTDVPQTNALFSGRAPSYNSAQWVCALASGVGQGDSPPYGGNTADHTLVLNSECIGGLIYGKVEYSSGDEEGAVDDDYTVHVTVNWTPEISKF